MAGAVAILIGQTPRSMVGTVVAIRAGSSEIEIKADAGLPVTVKFTAETVFQRVAPGEKNLRNAVAASLAGVAAGDRVLVTLKPDTVEARRIVVMPAAEIVKRNEADRQDWTRRGAAGVVAARSGNRITLRIRSFQGESQATVICGDGTIFRRYAPDSVKFADAKPSNAGEIRTGDQLRARGEKSADGLSVTADEVVFGTFVTKAGTITAIRAEQGEITIQDLENGRPLVVKLTADSQIKSMPGFPAFSGTGGPGGRPGAQPPVQGGFHRVESGPGMQAGGPAQGGVGRMGPGPGPSAGGPPDFSQMLERMPSSSIGSLKVGETVVFSSTRGASTQQLTAIMLLGNAQPLVEMAAKMSRGSQSDGLSAGGSMGLGSTMGGTGGLELPGMIP